MPVELEGGCACGEVRYKLRSEPLIVHCCHCLNCQRHTGSAFVINMLIEANRVDLLRGAPVPVEMPLNGGSPNRIFRCPTCQVALWSEYGGRSEVRFVRGGSLDDPSKTAPDVHIYTKSKLPWVELPESVLAFEEFYDPKTVWPKESQDRRKAAMDKSR